MLTLLIVALLVVVDVEGLSVKKTVVNIENELTEIKAELELLEKHRGQTVGFYADFGKLPFKHVTLTQGSPVLFDHVPTNVGNGYDIATGVFTAPYPGLYVFHLHIIGGNHEATNELGIYKGDETLAVAFAAGHQRDNNDQGSCTAVVQLLAGDEISVRLRYGDPQLWGSRLTSFSGELVHSD